MLILGVKDGPPAFSPGFGKGTLISVVVPFVFGIREEPPVFSPGFGKGIAVVPFVEPLGGIKGVPVVAPGREVEVVLAPGRVIGVLPGSGTATGVVLLSVLEVFGIKLDPPAFSPGFGRAIGWVVLVEMLDGIKVDPGISPGFGKAIGYVVFDVEIELISNGGDVVVVVLSSVVDTRVGVGVVASVSATSVEIAYVSASAISVEVTSVSSTIGIASVRSTVVLVSAGTLVSDVVS